MGERRLTIAVFGASGATGREVIADAVARGWQVNGMVRRAGTIGAGAPGVREIVGDFASAAAVRETMAGADAVVVVIGPRPPFSDVFCADATQAIVDAARGAGVDRLVCQTGALIGSYPANQGRVFKWMGNMMNRRMQPSARDRIAQEDVVRRSGLRWTIVKPPRLTAGARTGRVAVGAAVRVGLLSAISRKDLAAVLLDQCERDGAGGETLFVRADPSSDRAAERT